MFPVVYPSSKMLAGEVEQKRMSADVLKHNQVRVDHSMEGDRVKITLSVNANVWLERESIFALRKDLIETQVNRRNMIVRTELRRRRRRFILMVIKAPKGVPPKRALRSVHDALSRAELLLRPAPQVSYDAHEEWYPSQRSAWAAGTR